MPHDIFISYSRRNLETVKEIKRKIDSVLELHCWMDLKDIPSGEEFDERITKAIDEAKIVLFFLSKESQASEWSKKEYYYATEQKKRIVPIRFNRDPLVGVFKLHLGGANIIDWRNPVLRKKLLRDLAKWLGKPEPDLSGEITWFGPQPVSKKPSRLKAVAAIAIAAIAATALVLHGRRNDATDNPKPESFSPTPVSSTSETRAVNSNDTPENTLRSAPPTSGESWRVPLSDRIEMAFVYCPSGIFKMGSPPEEPGRYWNESSHFVSISRHFWIGETEVTQGQWRSLTGTSLLDQARLAYEDETVMEIGGATGFNRDFNEIDASAGVGRLCGDPDDETAMYNVSWEDATNFCARLTEQERAAGRLPAGYVYRLPTEAEWEYAARAGSTASLPDGSDLDILGCRDAPAVDSQGWYAGNSSVGFSGTGVDTANWEEKQIPGGIAHVRRVRQKAPNGWGLYDTIGNVFEWCWDWFDFTDYQPGFAKDPTGPASGTHHAVRGGSWMSLPVGCCRLANRRGGYPGRRTVDYGFRVVLAPELE